MVCKCKTFIVESCKIKCSKCSQKGYGFINNVVNKLPFEFHLPGHNFTGPGTQLLWCKTRLNPDLAYKDSNKPINRVEESAYRHYVYYFKNKDTKTRNKVCDKNIQNLLDNAENPTFREKIDRGVVKPIFWSKQKLGMGDLEIFHLYK